MRNLPRVVELDWSLGLTRSGGMASRIGREVEGGEWS